MAISFHIKSLEQQGYEHNMSISYDGVSRTVTVYFRGKRTVLSGTYSTWEAGMRAGKEFCRFQGWFG
jgi:hypothetical protein